MQRSRVRRQPRAKTREQLLDAAARVFARHGFHGASVEAVSEEAGFSTGAVYSNFESKEELFLTLYEERMDRRRRELRETVEQSRSPTIGLASAAASLGEVLRRERNWFLLYFEFSLHAARDPVFARRFENLRQQGLAELADGLARALGPLRGDVSLAPRELAQVIRALSYGLALDRLVDEGSVPDSLPGRALEFLFRGLRQES